MAIEIKKDDLSDGTIEKLLSAHLQEMYKYSPPESIHALDPKALRDTAVTFWAARIDGKLAGCGALKKLGSRYGEVKSMKTDTEHLRKGVAKQLLQAIINEAKKLGYSKIFLETGSHEAFQPAINMYEKNGFVECGPFGDYENDPYSKFFKKKLNP